MSVHETAGEQTYEPILDGRGETDYARYMKVEELLGLHRFSGGPQHRDEILFKTVHQTTELWLAHACFEATDATSMIRSGEPRIAARYLARAGLAIRLVTDELEMLRHLGPWSFQSVRTVLGHGSGAESPGWQGVQTVSDELAEAFQDYVARQNVDLVAIYCNEPDSDVYALAEALVEWDERISVWRSLHYKVAARVIGLGAVGTKGGPVGYLSRLIDHQYFPELWELRTELTRRGPLGSNRPRETDGPE